MSDDVIKIDEKMRLALEARRAWFQSGLTGWCQRVELQSIEPGAQGQRLYCHVRFSCGDAGPMLPEHLLFTREDAVRAAGVFKKSVLLKARQEVLRIEAMEPEEMVDGDGEGGGR